MNSGETGLMTKQMRGSGSGFSRREILGFAAAGMAGTYALNLPKHANAQEDESDEVFDPVSCAVIGVGRQGRNILQLLQRSPLADVKALCDVYEPYRRRASRMAPDAQAFEDYRVLLDACPDIQAVFVATPTHRHREIVERVLAAGKDVYCEAPMASSIEDARAIAAAAQKSDRTFAVGLQLRSNAHYNHAIDFLEVGAIGDLVMDVSSHHVNTNWKRPVGDPAFQSAMDWRVSSETSLGIPGEMGVHSFGTSLEIKKEWPSKVTSFGSIMKWRDGRDIHDSAKCIVEYPSGYQSHFEGTLVNSSGGQHHVIHGTHGAILLTEKRCWLFKEADAPSLGWEVYARRERVMQEDGIVLVANATKLIDDGEEPADFADQELNSTSESIDASLEDFLQALQRDESPASGYLDGYQAVVLAASAQEALLSGSSVSMEASWFELSE